MTDFSMFSIAQSVSVGATNGSKSGTHPSLRAGLDRFIPPTTSFPVCDPRGGFKIHPA